MQIGMRRLEIIHRTYYNFSGPVQLAPHRLLLRPREGHELRILSARLDTWPLARIRWHRDAFDNAVAIASFDTPATRLEIASQIMVEHYDEAPLDFLVDESAVHYPFEYEADTGTAMQPYLRADDVADPSALEGWLAKLWQPGEPVETYVLLARLCKAIQQSFSYEAREQPGVQSAADTLARGIGSCRDFATLFLKAVRFWGLAARFVSGYLNAPSSDGRSGASHAWAEVYLPGAGWKGFDPTIGEITGSRHIAVAVARRPDTVSPVTGSYFGPPGAKLAVGVWVREL
jgi:transglutaminase-like putative cysteine protease